MTVTYNWPSDKQGPGFVNSVEIKDSHVPRKGDTVNLNVYVSPSQQARHIGVVKTVEWVYENELLDVIIQLT